MTPDLVVIGAGPAGLAAAIAAARHGVRTLVLERRWLPIDKACGEGLLPNGVGALARLGIATDAFGRSAVALTGIRYITSSGRTATSSFPGGPGFGMRRLCLSDALAARARSEQTLELRAGERADVQWSTDGARVTVGQTSWRPRLVIGADGLHSRVRQASGIATVHGRRRRWGVRQHYAGSAWTDHVEVYFGHGFEAYVTPIAGGINVAWLWDGALDRHADHGAVGRARCGALDRHADRGALDLQVQGHPMSTSTVCDLLLSRMPVLAERLRAHRPTDRPQAAGPFRHRPRERARDGLLLMGDAAGYLDPLTGEGVGLALLQAELFEHHVVPLLAGGSGPLPASAFGPYLRAVDIASRSNHDLTRLMLSLASHPALVERIVSALDADPALFRHCLDVNMGQARMWPLPARSWLTLGAALCRLS